MHKTSRGEIIAARIALFAITAVVTLLTSSSFAALPPEVPKFTAAKPRAVLRYDPEISNLNVPPPPSFSQIRPHLRTQHPTFSVNLIAEGDRDAVGTVCHAWPDGAKNAFDYAMSIWASVIEAPIPVDVDACWADLGRSVLGYSGANDYVVTGSIVYPVALANALSGSDLNGPEAEINVTFNRNFDWYWLADGNAPTHQIDFVTVVLHEVCHGLGFGGSMAIDSGLGYWGFGMLDQPAIYDRFTSDGSHQALLDYANGSLELAAQLTSNNVYFDGAGARAANGGSPPKLFAPSVWMPGSSYAHLDEAFDGTPNALMTYSLGRGESVHNPGPVTLGMLQDLGWDAPEASPDLNVSLAMDRAADVGPGENIEYAISLANVGTGLASGVTITNVLAGDVLTPTWSVSASLQHVYLQPGANYVWRLDVMEVGASGAITVSGTLDPALAGEFIIVNTASVSARERELNTANNSATITIGGRRDYMPLAIKAGPSQGDAE
jgi:uncharacterized repeat protein (TIGR01451 family)